MKRILPAVCAVIWMFVLTGPILGQISHGGIPAMNSEDFSASKVLYLLESEDPVILDGLKSTKYNSYKKALHYATERPVDISPDMNGEWIDKEGVSIWRAHLISPGAFSVGILFSEFLLNKDAKVFLYDPDGEVVKGAFTVENNKEFGSFYVGHIPGEEVVIELQVINSGREYGQLRIGLLSHAFLPVYANKSMDDTGLGTSQECEIDINCIEGEDWQIIKRSVCHINTPTLLCTGTLINNTAYNGKPYVITAEHCINKSIKAENSIFYFSYENSECGIEDALMDNSISGSTMVSTGGNLDFTLLKLSIKPPRVFNVYYAGWDVRNSNHLSSVTLHHPNADAMKISIDLNSTVNAVDVPGDLNDYLVSSNFEIEEWDVGTTEGGSSGCPLFNSSKRLIGVLSGGLAMCGEPIGYDEEKDRVIYSLDDNSYDYFSKLYFDWEYHSEGNKQLKKWLDPINSGQLSIGGLAMNSVDVGKVKLSDGVLIAFPNPSDGELSLSLPEYSGKEMHIVVYDHTGKLQSTQTVLSIFPIQISLRGLPSGIYVIRISGDDTIYTGRIMLKQ